jgi:hypothetical protein
MEVEKMTESRKPAERKADVLAAFERQGDLFLATADRSGKPHVIAVSAWWDGSEFVIATTGTSRTARNLQANPIARLALGSPADAVMADVKVVESQPAESAAPAVAEGFKDAVGWDPREVGPGWVYVRLAPSRIQAFRGYDELEGRDVMRNSGWME